VAASEDILASLRGLRMLFVGGEVFHAGGPGPARGVRAAGRPGFNMYGRTETTVWCSVHEVRMRIDRELSLPRDFFTVFARAMG
jgi:hypothetical protein